MQPDPKIEDIWLEKTVAPMSDYMVDALEEERCDVDNNERCVQNRDTKLGDWGKSSRSESTWVIARITSK